jgi:RimJ/RimL family protein N-acetyltransferase
VRAVTVWAFISLALQRVQLFHAVGNEASCRVAEKAGYALEGRLRSATIYGDGLRHDDHLHARLAAEG